VRKTSSSDSALPSSVCGVSAVAASAAAPAGCTPPAAPRTALSAGTAARPRVTGNVRREMAHGETRARGRCGLCARVSPPARGMPGRACGSESDSANAGVAAGGGRMPARVRGSPGGTRPGRQGRQAAARRIRSMGRTIAWQVQVQGMHSSAAAARARAYAATPANWWRGTQTSALPSGNISASTCRVWPVRKTAEVARSATSRSTVAPHREAPAEHRAVADVEQVANVARGRLVVLPVVGREQRGDGPAAGHELLRSAAPR
jgi:hypothetical protein